MCVTGGGSFSGRHFFETDFRSIHFMAIEPPSGTFRMQPPEHILRRLHLRKLAMQTGQSRAVHLFR